MSTVSNQILSDIIVHNKYAKYLEDANRRETWEEIVDRNVTMHCQKFPELFETIIEIYHEYVLTKKVLPSMRSMQFGGVPIIRNPSRIYNCAYMPANDTKFFSELMFLLLGGTGVGYSVQLHHVAQLPTIQGVDTSKRRRRYMIGDSIEGWSDAIKVLVESYFFGKAYVSFDYSDIRAKGTPLKTSGGLAPGPAPLRKCLEILRSYLEETEGKNLTSLQVHDIACHIAAAVLAGGIRRAAMISLFSMDDESMISCKAGKWYETQSQRAFANNSIIIKRGTVTNAQFIELWKRIKLSGAGEPGIYWTFSLEWGTNPCCEIALRAFQFCNLTEVNVSDVEDQEEFNKRVSAAAFIGTLQAGYTDFHYLRPEWQEVTEEDALIGVGLTGIGSGKVLTLDLVQAAQITKDINETYARLLGINSAARTTTIKPSGTASIVLGCSSGVHAWHGPYYLRRVRLNKVEPIYQYLLKELPEMVEDSVYSPSTEAILSIPQAAPEGSIFRDEPVMELLERAMMFNVSWVAGGFNSGSNQNNVSCTLSLKEEDWGPVGEKLWEYKDLYNGMSVIPYDGGSYTQAPFEEITKEEYERLEKSLHLIDLTRVSEFEDRTNLTGEAACSGGLCEIV